MNNKSDKRKFNRFTIEFAMEVSSKDIEGNEYRDTTDLKDISGGGIKFITKQKDRYFLGQLLEITIHLPGTKEVKFSMSGKANVIRIDSSDRSGIDKKSLTASIATKLVTQLSIERVELKTQGDNNESQGNQ
jgi:hypothetical protein